MPAALSSHPFIKTFDDEAERFGVDDIAGSLRNAQNTDEPFTVGGDGLDNGGKVTRHDAPPRPERT
ncbi:MAG: hypothetical protein ACJ8DK_17085 [Microvirga sp.]|jgi:hypothetical protein